MGNLTRDPEVRYTPNGTAVADVGLAVNRVWTNDQGERMEETTFVDVTLWGRRAEIISEYAKKGDPVYIEGYLKMDQWDDKETGQKRSKLKVVCENLQLLKRKEAEDKPQQKPSARKQPPAAPPKPPRDPDLDASDSDIPF